MSYSSNPPGPSPPPGDIESTISLDRLLTDTESDSPLTGTAKELLDVLVATNDLLETVSLENLQEVVDVGELPKLVDLERLMDAIRARNPDLAFDLSHLEQVVNRRELWNSIDVLEFAKAKRRLGRELEDVPLGGTSIDSWTDSEAVADAKAFASSLRDEAKNAMVQQEAQERLKVLQEGVVDAHREFERLHVSNKDRFGNSDGRSTGGKGTAVSLLPSDPLPTSVSTRLSTVPSEVRYAIIDPLPRIYGRRWRREDSRETRAR